MRTAGLVLSVGLHAGGAALLVFGWPYLSPSRPLIVPDVPIELISEAELAEEVSIPEMTREEADEPPAPEPDPEPEEAEPEPAPEPASAPPPEPEPEPAAPPPPDEAEEPTEPEEPEPPKAAPEPAPAAEPDEPEDDFALDDLVIDLDPDKQDRKKPREVSEDTASGAVDAERVGTGRTLTITEEAALKQAFVRCWQEPSAVPNRERLIVRVRVRLNRNGTLNGAPVVLNDGEIDRSGNRFWQTARINAVAAVTACAPYDFLPDQLILDAIDEGGFDYTFRPDPA